MDIISLNDLPNTPHNALFKLFASKTDQKRKASAIINRLVAEGKRVARTIMGLMNLITKGDDMTQITSEYLQELGKEFEESVVVQAPDELRLKGLSDESRLKGLSEESRLKGVSEESRLKGLSDESRLKGLSVESVVTNFSKAEMDALFRLLASRKDHTS